MDSMRNLRGSLPASGSRSRQTNSPGDLLQTFKQAALNVTNLYRQANEEMALERRAGYQDAIYELISKLDKENIGLSDGEGWRIRQWATEKQQTGPENEAGSDGEDNAAEERDVSPIQEEEQHLVESSPPREVRREGSRESDHQLAAPAAVPSSGEFTFRASHSYPEPNMEVSSIPSEQQHPSRVSSSRQASGQRHLRRSSQAPAQRPSPRNSRLGPGAGNKRKDHYGDLFGLANLGDGKDPFGGHGPNKRHRPT